MTYDQLKNQVDKILEQAESEMESMIEKFNENNEAKRIYNINKLCEIGRAHV